MISLRKKVDKRLGEIIGLLFCYFFSSNRSNFVIDWGGFFGASLMERKLFFTINGNRDQFLIASLSNQFDCLAKNRDKINIQYPLFSTHLIDSTFLLIGFQSLRENLKKK